MPNNFYCAKCGARMPMKYRFCTECGYERNMPALEIDEGGFRIYGIENGDRPKRNTGDLAPLFYNEKMQEAPLSERFGRESLLKIFRKCRELNITECCVLMPMCDDFVTRQTINNVSQEAQVKVTRCISRIEAMLLAHEYDRCLKNDDVDVNCLVFDFGQSYIDIVYAGLGGEVAESICCWEYEETDLAIEHIWTNEQKMSLFHETAKMLNYNCGNGEMISDKSESISHLKRPDYVIIPNSAYAAIHRGEITEVCEMLTGNHNLPVITAEASIGAVLQAGKLTKRKESANVLLVTSEFTSIGAILPNGRFVEIIGKDTTVPYKETVTVSSEDGISVGAKVQIVQKQIETGKVTRLKTLTIESVDENKETAITVAIDANKKIKYSIE